MKNFYGSLQLIIELPNPECSSNELLRYIEYSINNKFAQLMLEFNLEPRQNYLLRISILNIVKGNPLVRSSMIFSFLGFGNSKLHLSAELINIGTKKCHLRKIYKMRHTGLNKGWQDYMQDNSNILLKELAESTIYKVVNDIKKKALIAERSQPIYIQA